MTHAILTASLSPPSALVAAPAALPLLHPAGARVILGERLPENGLPTSLAPQASSLFGPRGVACAGPNGPLFVTDTGHHRLMIWNSVPFEDYAPADLIIGQPDFVSEGRNGKGPVGPATLNMPSGIATDGKILAVADAWNHRVLIWQSLPTRSNQPADIVLGQEDFSSEFANRGTGTAGADTLNWCYGVTIADGKLYVADTGNRRVLIWNSIPEASGAPADLVLGQIDMITRDDNGGVGGDASGMRWPHAVVVNEGRIYVSDAGNSRIMVWNGSPNANGAPCSFVLGQGDFGGIDHNAARLSPTERSLQMPYGLVMHGGTLICADTANSRLMGFAREGLGMGARAVGLAAQRGFGAKGDNRWQVATRDSVCWPFAVTSCGDLVVVADTGNNRVLLWEAA